MADSRRECSASVPRHRFQKKHAWCGLGKRGERTVARDLLTYAERAIDRPGAAAAIFTSALFPQHQLRSPRIIPAPSALHDCATAGQVTRSIDYPFFLLVIDRNIRFGRTARWARKSISSPARVQ